MATEQPESTPTPEPWFANGLYFICTQCGACCTGSAGSVWVSQVDIQRLAAFLNMPPGRFVRRYTRRVKGERVLVDKEGTTDCVFLRDRTCTVYDGRPTQCRTYPWWLQNIQDEESWREAAAVCEGINHPTAALIPLHEIVEQVTLDQQNESSAG